MAFLDFIKDRQAAWEQSVANSSQVQKPETAKEMYTQQAAEEKATQGSMEQIPDADKASAEEVVEGSGKGTQHRKENSSGRSATPVKAGRQNMTGQEGADTELSPRRAQAEKAPKRSQREMKLFRI